MLRRPRSLRSLVTRLMPALIVALGASACGGGVSLDEPIEGPVWWLTQLGEQPVSWGNEPQRDAQIAFERSGGRAVGAGGCNRFSGSFSRGAGTLRISQLGATKMACADPVRQGTEVAFFAALQATAAYRLDGATGLTLLDAGGRTVARLSRAAPR